MDCLAHRGSDELKALLRRDPGHWGMTSPPAPPRIVAAVGREVQRRMRAMLPGCELHFAQTGSQLVRALDEAPCDIMLVEIHFDESTAVAALKCARSRNGSFPVVCLRSVPFAKVGPPALDALRTAMGELGPQFFIDLLQYSDDDAGNASVRAVLAQLAPGMRTATPPVEQAHQINAHP